MLAAICAVILPGRLEAGGGPENYMLVVNSTSPASLAIANHYVALRQIPSSNVLYIPWKGDRHTTDVDTFRKQILQPIIQAVHERDLTSHIDGVVYSSDFPYVIDFKNDFDEKIRAKLHQAMTPMGSINGLTYYYQFVLAKQPMFVDFRASLNFYFRPIVNGKQLAETRGFRGWYGWGKDGELLESGGTRYLLSAMLGQTVGKASTPEEVVAYLRRSAKADGSAPLGTVYFVSNDDIRAKARLPLYEPAVAELKKLKVNAEIVAPAASTALPENKPDIAGLSMGFPTFNVAGSGSTILPGAICENLTSFGAETKMQVPQTLLSDFLDAGAAGSSGTPVEPLLVVEKFPNPFIQVHYARGCTMAEAFYQSVAAPYQLVIVGDPLCRPWAQIPKIEAPELNAGDTLQGQITIRPSASGGAVGVDRFALYLDGLLVARCGKDGTLELDTAQHSDGSHELRIVGTEPGPIETQGRLIAQVNFDNHGRKVSFTASARRAVLGQRIKLTAEANDAREVYFFTTGRQLERVTSSKGVFTCTVDAETLGAGPVTLRALAIGSGGVKTYAMAPPITLQIVKSR